MYSPDKYKNKAARSTPLQTRGKERVRVILAAALALYKERGIANVTTNDIAKRAGIPIGSLYRYYPNKDEITLALTELYVEDVGGIFEEIGRHPMLASLAWEEILLLLVDGWVNYSRLNGPHAFLHAGRADPKLSVRGWQLWRGLRDVFATVLVKRCHALTPRQLAATFHMVVSAVQMGTEEGLRKTIGQDAHLETIGAIAEYLRRACDSSESQADLIMS